MAILVERGRSSIIYYISNHLVSAAFQSFFFLVLFFIFLCHFNSEICNKESSSSPSNEFLSINETEEIQRRISSMKSNLTVPVNSTSQYIRTKTCAEDDRFSSRAIGTALGAGLISLLAALILFPDIKKVIYFSFQQLTAVCKRNDADKTHT